LKTETDSRDSHGGQARIKAARFPARKTLEEFDFAFQTSLKRDTALHLGELDFLAGRENVVLLGPPGTSLGVPILIRAAQPTVEYVHLVLAAGAGGVLSHSYGGEVFLAAVGDVVTREAVVPVLLRETLKTRLLRGEALSYRALSTQERRVAGYVASGATAKRPPTGSSSPRRPYASTSSGSTRS